MIGSDAARQRSCWAPGVPATIIGWGFTRDRRAVRTASSCRGQGADGQRRRVRRRLGRDFNAATMVCAGGGTTDTCAR